MNTGGQRSGGTPMYAETTTNPVARSRGKEAPKKNLPLIFAAHYVPYVATASVAFPEDLMAKVKYARILRAFA